MICKKCHSARVATVTAKCSDCCRVQLQKHEHDGYVPGDMGIGSDDYVEFDYCLDCGHIQGRFPIAKTKLEKGA